MKKVKKMKEKEIRRKTSWTTKLSNITSMREEMHTKFEKNAKKQGTLPNCFCKKLGISAKGKCFLMPLPSLVVE